MLNPGLRMTKKLEYPIGAKWPRLVTRSDIR